VRRRLADVERLRTTDPLLAVALTFARKELRLDAFFFMSFFS
jgi:hypothetical protein